MALEDIPAAGSIRKGLIQEKVQFSTECLRA
jgi:hypothetical protein